MFSERFIQDAISRPNRMEWLVHDLGRNWQFTDSEDFINQEYSFSAGGECGRIDVICTFNCRRKLAIVEVKAGEIGDEDVRQLSWYLNHSSELIRHDQLSKTDEIVGILLAEGCRPLSHQLPQDIFLIEFKLIAEDGSPFHPVLPQIGIVHPGEGPSAVKNSTLWRLSDHRDYLLDDALKQAFTDVTALFTEPQNDRAQWILVNPKGDHVAVHYKGEYITSISVRRQYFVLAYGSEDGQVPWKQIKVTGGELGRLSDIKREILATMDRTDKELSSSIPAGYKWTI